MFGIKADQAEIVIGENITFDEFLSDIKPSMLCMAGTQEIPKIPSFFGN
jgi:hypothetical protein